MAKGKRIPSVQPPRTDLRSCALSHTLIWACISFPIFVTSLRFVGVSDKRFFPTDSKSDLGEYIKGDLDQKGWRPLFLQGPEVFGGKLAASKAIFHEDLCLVRPLSSLLFM